MKLYQIIEANELPTQSILYNVCQPYLKSLKVYYEDLFCDNVIMMVTSISNAAQYIKFVPANEFNESICEYLEVDYISEDENESDYNEDLFAAYETINFNSQVL